MDADGHFPPVVQRYFQWFARDVSNGKIVRSDHHVTDESQGVDVRRWHHVLFVLPGEEWRIDAMMQLKSIAERWTEAHEREEGRLLGYSEQENDWWIAYCKRNGTRFEYD
ncbi:hypothetical protein [Pontixanthobacter aquaemixtae]|uniref:Uncharacterized protein n=1 Tax=Pontixanthobacter aquaemixtae TaxID=1958940 RepID=A0A845A0A0_9SPHN|nr:hypothetical protein [Pontixanthobacter aquaemixtae]MXO91109.1 hypothetical protein [Pontixanthobacter aquaemixtae]